uniref:Pentacotripeptide-repeat region of PRORP domain-containing protein n=6 Tax=Photinus pyralis TaxID=7054 RepID=A0A1Y1KWA2_PHOPY
MKCCGPLVVDHTPKARQLLCVAIFAKLKSLNLVDVQHYNTYLQVSIENKMRINYTEFLEQMSCEPNEQTFRLLLKAVCEVGDIQQAFKIVTAMKENKFLANEELFNVLVLAHAIRGGLNGVAPILKTMQSAHVSASDNTFRMIIRGLALYGDKAEFMKSLRMYSNVIQEKDFIHLLMVLGTKGFHSWFSEMIEITGLKQISKQNAEEFTLLCIALIHLGNSEAALLYYKQFVEPSSVPTGDFAFPLLHEMVIAQIEPKKIIDVISDLKKEDSNTVALERLLGVALKEGFMDTAWELLKAVTNIRPHYFWPFLLRASKERREIGVLGVLEEMLKMNVRPDGDTLEYYCIHFCDTEDPHQLLVRLHKLGLTVREILTPLVSFLIKQSRIDLAVNLCHQYDVALSAHHVLPSLLKNWNFKTDVNNIVVILKKLIVDAHDAVSQVLVKVLKKCNSLDQLKFYLQLVQALKLEKIDINPTVAEHILNGLRSKEPSPILKEIESLICQFEGTSIESSAIPHPRDMNLPELENHLIQLESKGMETRGVLRLLINEHCRCGNIERVLELRKSFHSKGYRESAGMKTSLMHAYIMNDHLDDALSLYSSIKEQHPNFKIDEFKIVDLACLLIKSQQFTRALEILKYEAQFRRIQGGPQLVKNCWKLLGACEDEMELQKLFSMLIQLKYCTPSNIILGPLVKIHLKKENLDKAVSVYKECVTNYKCTPLQLELLSAVVRAEKLDLMQEVLNYSAQVHGSESMVVPCIASFAQNGLYKILGKFLLEVSAISKEEMEKRCERWVYENNLLALETLAKACQPLRSNVIDKPVLYTSIMKIHSINNDCEAAVSFYRELVRNEIEIPKNVSNELLQLVQRCKYELPQELA